MIYQILNIKNEYKLYFPLNRFEYVKSEKN